MAVAPGPAQLGDVRMFRGPRIITRVPVPRDLGISQAGKDVALRPRKVVSLIGGTGPIVRAPRPGLTREQGMPVRPRVVAVQAPRGVAVAGVSSQAEQVRRRPVVISKVPVPTTLTTRPLPALPPIKTRPKEIMRLPSDGRPGDERRFIHKKLLGGISKIAGILPIPGANIISGVTGVLAGRGRRPPPRTLTARPSEFSAAEKNAGREFKFSGGGGGTAVSRASSRAPCPAGFRVDFRSGQCEPGGGQPVGDGVMGNYGAGLVPGSLLIDRAVCLRGMVLGNDGVCYNKGNISNKQREWPAGRKPLLSGGDMRAISIAARAGRRLEGATKRLQRLGMMKKPSSRRAAPGRRPLSIREAGAGSVTVQ